MSFHYQRYPWKDGGVGRGEGEPPGSPLRALIADGLPPVRVGLEVAAALCEIAYIAAEDGEVHGDLWVDDVWITGDGVVSLGGFGVARSRTRAPEGVPRGTSTDRYGLGRAMAAVLLPGSSALDAVARGGAGVHDDAVAAFVRDADLGDASPPVANDVRWFILYLMSFDRAERPEPLRAWRSLIAFARTVPGPELAAWAEAAHRGGADRRAGALPVAPEDRLGSAVTRGGPLAGGLSFSSEASRTLFWKKDDLQADPPQPAEEAAAPASGWAAARGPELGGGERTGHWSIGELRAMAAEAMGAPRPQRTEPVYSDRAAGSGRRASLPGSRSSEASSRAADRGSRSSEPAPRSSEARPTTVSSVAAPEPAREAPRVEPAPAERRGGRQPEARGDRAPRAVAPRSADPAVSRPPTPPDPAALSPVAPAPAAPPVAWATPGPIARAAELAGPGSPEASAPIAGGAPPATEEAMPRWVLYFLVGAVGVSMCAIGVLLAALLWWYLQQGGGAVGRSVGEVQ